MAWSEGLRKQSIETAVVQYPGRETRLSEPAITDWRHMIIDLADHWDTILRHGPYALFGHSMGALLSYELAQELVRRKVQNLPRRLFLSGRSPPHIPPKALVDFRLPDRQFLRLVAQTYGELPEEVLANQELAAFVASTLRADFALLKQYRWDGSAPLQIPLTVFGGADDPCIVATDLDEWQQHTVFPVEVHVLPGGHFFHYECANRVAQLMARESLGSMRVG